MELVTRPPIAASIPVDAKPEAVDEVWIHVTEWLPEDGEPVHVILERSRDTRIAWRGHYQSTGAWFDATTRQPIYEAIAHWKAMS